MDIAVWLRELGLECYEEAFRHNEIDARSLHHLTTDDLREIGVVAVGHRRILSNAIAELRRVSGRANLPTVPRNELSPGPVAAKPDAERRQLTVLFCDMVDSTQLATQLDPEDLREIITVYHDCSAMAVETFSGHIAQFVGDGVVAYFGYPQAHEDDAERAIRAGLALVESVAELKPRHTAKLRVRVGIASGPVVVGDLIGEGPPQADAVVGDTPALAARLQAIADPGGVIISENTRRLVGDLFQLLDLGPTPIKGFPNPIQSWRVIGEGQAESRFDALRGERLTPLIGRQHEMNLLLERWLRAKEGEGQVVLIEGEPGIGKSRLVREMRNRLSNEPLTPLSHYCSPYHQNTVAHPIVVRLVRAAGIKPNDPPSLKLGKLEALLAKGSDQPADATPLVADLLGIPIGSRYQPINLPPAHKAKKTMAVLLQQMEGLAAEQPVLAIYEDLNWGDPTTLEILDLLVERIQRQPVLMLITFRPEFEKRWISYAHVTSFSLSRLTRRYSVDLVNAIVGQQDVPDRVLSEILTRSDGIPLFIEELTEAVVESGLLQNADDSKKLHPASQPLAIPATLKDSLMARLDRLAHVREVAQLAAVIGREFSLSLLAAVTRMSEEELSEALDQLVDAQLVFRRGTPMHATYRFKHALVQEAAYESLLLRRRQEIHGVVARAIERHEQESIAEQSAILAYHYERSLEPSKAVTYALLAGDQAMKFHARIEATTYYERALTLARELPSSLDSQQMQIDAMLKLGAVGASPEELQRDEQNLEQARALAESISDTRRLSQALYWLGRLAHMRGAFAQAVDYAEQSLALAEELDDNSLAAPPVNLLGRDCYLMGEYERAGRLLARSVDQMREIGDMTEEATAAGFAGITLAAVGEFRRGLEYTQLGLRLADKLGNPFVKAAAHNYCAVAYCHHGAWANAIAACDAARRAAESVDDRFRIYLLQYYEGQGYTMNGDPVRGRALLEDSIALARQFGTTNLLALGKAKLGNCLYLLGEVEVVPPICREAIELAESTHDMLALGMAHRTLAEALGLLDQSNGSDARDAIENAIDVQKKYRIRPELARSYLSYSRLLRDWDQESEADDYRRRAMDLFSDMDMEWDLQNAKQDGAAMEIVGSR